MLKRVFAGFIVAAMLGGGAAVAGPFEDGHAAYKRGDDVEAVRWWRLAADQGNASARSLLGLMYQSGRGVPQNHAEAVRWYRLAADQGDASAQHSLGAMYDKGRGVPQNHAEAVRWYRLAAEHGDATAQSFLGLMYDIGSGVPQDYVVAHMWFNLAAAQGYENAIKYRDEAASKMTPDQIAEAQRLARDWKPSAPRQ